MSEVPPSQPEWVPVADAAQTAGIPPRTVYRWIKEKRLPSRREGKTLLVDLSAVLVLAQDRASAAPIPAPGAGALPTRGTAGKVAQPAVVDGNLAGQVFALFDQGEAPINVVTRLCLPPPTVIDLHRQYTSLRDLAGAGQPSVAERIASLEKGQGELRQQLSRLSELVTAADRGMDDAIREVWQTFERQAEQVQIALDQLGEEIAKRPTFTCKRCGSLIGRISSTCAPCASANEADDWRARGGH